MLGELKPAVKQVVTTRSTHPRAAAPEDLAAIAGQVGYQAVASGTVEEALREAEQLTGEKTIILVTGSVFVAAAARSVWMAAERDRDLAQIGKQR